MDRRLPLVPMLIWAAAAWPGGADAAEPDPVWSAASRTTGFVYQTVEPDGTETTRNRWSQHLSGRVRGLASGRLDLRAAGRFTELPYLAPLDTETARLHVLHLDARLGRNLSLRAGRQFVTAGVTALTLDGARLSGHGGRAGDWAVWAGRRTPWNLEATPASVDRGLALGGRYARRLSTAWKLGLSGAYRERDAAVAERTVGWDAAGRPFRAAQLGASGAYDLLAESWRRLEVQGRWRNEDGRLEVTARLVDRRPSIDATSWFSRFTDLARVRLARVGVRRTTARGIGVEVAGTVTAADERTTRRLNLALLAPAGTLGYSLRLGDFGEENSFFGQVRHRPRSWLLLEAEASLLTYTLWRDAPVEAERELTTLAARARVRLRDGVRLLCEVQSLTSPLYDRDVRVLCGLDLAARGGGVRSTEVAP